MSYFEIQDKVITGLYAETVPNEHWEGLLECPLCDSQTSGEEIVSVGYGPTLAVCHDCHFGFLNRRPTEEWINNFYALQWDQTGPPKSVTPNPRAFDTVKKYFKGSRVVDVGAGYGGMLLPFRAAGASVEAIEASNQRADFLLSQGIEIASPSISEAPEGSYDLAIMHHSLEHVYDPVETVRQLSRVLTDDGMIYIAVPDLWQEHPIQAAHYVPHLSLFTMESLLDLIRVNGFCPLVVQGGYDLEILAVKSDHYWTVQQDYDFPEIAQEWVKAATGGTSGPTTMIWSVQAMDRLRYPKWLAHGHMDRPAEVVPIGMASTLRVLWGNLDIDESGLLVLGYDQEQPNVWVK